jgi:hypothetical protein
MPRLKRVGWAPPGHRPPLEFGHSPNMVSDAALRLDLMHKPHSEAIRWRVGWAPPTILMTLWPSGTQSDGARMSFISLRDRPSRGVAPATRLTGCRRPMAGSGLIDRTFLASLLLLRNTGNELPVPPASISDRLHLVLWITALCFYSSRRERQERQEFAWGSIAPASLF